MHIRYSHDRPLAQYDDRRAFARQFFIELHPVFLVEHISVSAGKMRDHQFLTGLVPLALFGEILQLTEPLVSLFLQIFLFFEVLHTAELIGTAPAASRGSSLLQPWEE